MKKLYTAVLGMAFGAISFAQGNHQVDYIYPQDTLTNLAFSRVLPHGNTAVVMGNAYRPTWDTLSDGAIYIYNQDTVSNEWMFHQKLVHYKPTTTSTFFGEQFQFDGTHIIASARRSRTSPNQPYEHGQAFIYEKDASNNWSLDTALIWPHVDSAVFVDFGYAVAIDGDYAMVLADALEIVYIYERDASGTWNVIQEIDGSSYKTSTGGISYFGNNMLIDGEYAYFTAPFDDTDENGNNVLSQSGSVYVFHRGASTGQWTEVAKITAPSRTASARFGQHALVQDDFAIFSLSPFSNTEFHVYHRDVNSNWTHEQQIILSESVPSFPLNGKIFSKHGDRLAISAKSATVDSLPYAGKVFIFDEDASTGNWTETLTWNELSPGINKGIGDAVLASKDNLLVGDALYANGSINNAGRIFSVLLNANIGLVENGLIEWIEAYPNPASDRIFIRDENTSDPLTRYTIIDNTGRIALEDEFNSRKEIDLSQFAAGIYYLKTASQGGRIALTKIVVSK